MWRKKKELLHQKYLLHLMALPPFPPKKKKKRGRELPTQTHFPPLSASNCCWRCHKDFRYTCVCVRRVATSGKANPTVNMAPPPPKFENSHAAWTTMGFKAHKPFIGIAEWAMRAQTRPTWQTCACVFHMCQRVQEVRHFTLLPVPQLPWKKRGGGGKPVRVSIAV